MQASKTAVFFMRDQFIDLTILLKTTDKYSDIKSRYTYGYAPELSAIDFHKSIKLVLLCSSYTTLLDNILLDYYFNSCVVAYCSNIDILIVGLALSCTI